MLYEWNYRKRANSQTAIKSNKIKSREIIRPLLHFIDMYMYKQSHTLYNRHYVIYLYRVCVCRRVSMSIFTVNIPCHVAAKQ